jgi:hypothetical protein
MNDAGKPPVSKASKRPDGSWYADVLWHNGRREQIGHFKTALEVEDFIKSQLQAWHEAPKAAGTDRSLGWGRYSPSSGL